MTYDIRHTTDDKEKEFERMVLVQLRYYLNNSTAIHFRLWSGKWRNAIIRNIDEQEKKVSIKEFVLGNLEYYFSEINPYSITEYNLTHGSKENAN
jgi:hypothetical protein